MELTAKLDRFGTKLDRYGKPAWIILTVLGFVVFWPLGLAILAYIIWSGRMGFWQHCGPGRWHNNAPVESRANRHAGPPSGNHAFDEYREETLRRLEDEQEAFHAFLEQLRHAKDKAEFDQFMADRGHRQDTGQDMGQGTGPESGEGSSPQPAA